MYKSLDLCPKCGSNLTMREGAYGEFWACPRFPDCKFIKEESNYEKQKNHPPKLCCKKCNHTGYLPFIKKGKLIPHAFINCECKDSILEHDLFIHPPEYDFPCSPTYRDFEHYQKTGLLFNEQPRTETVKEIIPIKHIVHTIPVYPKKKSYKEYI